MKKISFLTLAATIMLLNSCIKTKDAINCDKVEVKFTSNIAPIQTRVGETTWNLNDPVGISMVEETFNYALFEPDRPEVLVMNKQYFASAGATATFTPANGTPMYYPIDGSDVQFSAYYPYSQNITVDFNNYVIYVDLSDQSDLSKIDLLWAESTSYNKLSGAAVLNFSHVMTKLVFNISNGTGITEPVSNGIDLAITNVDATACLRLYDGMTCGSGICEETLTARGNSIIEMIVCPTTQLKIPQVTFTNGAGQTFKVDIPLNLSISGQGNDRLQWQRGYKYIYNVTLKEGDSAAITGTIAPWTVENAGALNAYRE